MLFSNEMQPKFWAFEYAQNTRTGDFLFHFDSIEIYFGKE